MDDLGFVPDAAQPQARVAPMPPAMASHDDLGFVPDNQEGADHEKYDTAAQKIKTGIEGVAQGIGGPLAPFAEERYLGVKPEEIRARAEQHPIIHTAGEIGGLFAPGVGGLMGAAGETAAKFAIPEATTYAARVGSSAIKQAAEMAILQGSDETAKMVLQDPKTSTESAIANIGLAAALGGGAGAFFTSAVNPLWKATIGTNVENGLKALTSRLGGAEGEQVIGKAAGLEQQTGVPIASEFKSVIDSKPGARESHSILSQTDSTIAGRRYQKGLTELNDNLASKAIESLGRNPESIENLPDLDKYTRGREIGETLAEEFSPQVKEINTRYDKINNEFRNTPINNEDKRLLSEQIAQKALEKGWGKAESEAEMTLAKKVSEKIAGQETVEDLKKFITNLKDAHPYGSPTYQAAKDLKQILSQGQERIITDNIARSGETAGTAESKLAEYSKLKQDYSKLMDAFDGINEHLHVGRYDGPQSFLTALKEASSAHGERLLDRALGSKNADILQQLKAFPQTLEKVKQYHADKLLTDAVGKASPGARININNLVKKISELSPQVKEIIASPEQHKVIEAVGEALESLKDPTHNFSNTARTVAKMTHGDPSTLSLLATLAGHAEAGILSFIGKLGFTEGKDALRLGLMRFLSSEQPIKAEGFKAMVSMLDNAYKGESVLNRSVGAVFKTGAQVLTDAQLPSHADIEKLDKLIAKNQDNPIKLMEVQGNGSLGHYATHHQEASTQTITGAQQYLQQLKPQPIKLGPLGKELPPDKIAEARYHRALEIAEQPAIILQKIKDGTLQVTDLQDIKTMYPGYYQNLCNKLTNQMAGMQADDETIPYKTRIALSLCLGQPLEASMTPQAIVAAQPKALREPAQSPQQPKSGQKSKIGNKTNNLYKTPGQASESDRANRD